MLYNRLIFLGGGHRLVAIRLPCASLTRFQANSRWRPPINAGMTSASICASLTSTRSQLSYIEHASLPPPIFLLIKATFAKSIVFNSPKKRGRRSRPGPYSGPADNTFAYAPAKNLNEVWDCLSPNPLTVLGSGVA